MIHTYKIISRAVIKFRFYSVMLIDILKIMVIGQSNRNEEKNSYEVGTDNFGNLYFQK